MNLTATQTKILREAAESPIGCVFVESSAGRGPMGGTVRTGMRAVEAAADLVKFGLLRLDNTSTSTLPRNGFTVHTTCACYEITTEGLAAHAALTAQAA